MYGPHYRDEATQSQICNVYPNSSCPLSTLGLYDCNNNLSLKVICSIFAFICSSVFVLGGNKSGVTTTEAHLKSSHNLISCLCISYNTISNITIISSTLFFLSTYIILFHSNRNLDSLQLSFGYHKCFQTFLFNCFWLSNYPRFLM